MCCLIRRPRSTQSNAPTRYAEHRRPSRLRPNTPLHRLQLATIAAYVIFAVVTVAALRTLTVRNHDRTVQTWPTTIATILDTRTVPVGWWHSTFGSKLAYDVQVLVRYSSGSSPTQRWVTVQQQPRTKADAQLERFRWKGQTCPLFWNPVNPDEVVVDIR